MRGFAPFAILLLKVVRDKLENPDLTLVLRTPGRCCTEGYHRDQSGDHALGTVSFRPFTGKGESNIAAPFARKARLIILDLQQDA